MDQFSSIPLGLRDFASIEDARCWRTGVETLRQAKRQIDEAVLQLKEQDRFDGTPILPQEGRDLSGKPGLVQILSAQVGGQLWDAEVKFDPQCGTVQSATLVDSTRVIKREGDTYLLRQDGVTTYFSFDREVLNVCDSDSLDEAFVNDQGPAFRVFGSISLKQLAASEGPAFPAAHPLREPDREKKRRQHGFI